MSNHKQPAGGSPGEDDVLNELEAAKYVRVCTKTLRKLRQNTNLPYARVGGSILYLRPQLHKWLAEGGTSGEN